MRFLWLPALVLFAAAAVTRLNIGFRHILPMLPFLWVLGALAAARWLDRRLVRVGVLVLLSWYAAGTVWQHPDHLAYFNALVGGSDRGYLFLGDSNLDWGQDLNLLARYVQEAPAPVYYSYFGASDPSYYGLPGPEQLPEAYAPANPPPGQYALSATHVHGMLGEEDRFDWFRRQEPDGSLGHSILLYEVVAATPGSWIAHCLDPAPLLAPAEAAALVGRAEARQLAFDCREGWVFPEGGTPGWYVLPQQAEPWPLAEAFPARLAQIYKHSATEAAPSYDVYYWDGSDPVSGLALSPGQATTPGGVPVTLPVSAGGVARLLGSKPGDGGPWHTVWQAQEATGEPLSILAHLYGDGGPPEVADGLAFASDQWQPGDIFVQYHHAGELAAVDYLATGLYNYLDGEGLNFDLAGVVQQIYLYGGEDGR